MKNHKGITTIELLAILIIISIISLIAVPTVNTLIRNTENRAIEASLINMEEAVRLRRLDFTGTPPDFETLLQANGISNPQSTNNEHWALYGNLLLGPYVSGGLPNTPFGGIFSYRFYTEGEGFNTGSWNHSRRLRQPIINANGDLEIGLQLRQVFDLPSEPVTGEFLKIRFGENNNQLNGQFDLSDNTENTEAFLRTVEFLLNTSFADRVFVYDRRGNNEPSPNRDVQLVIMIYLDHTSWDRID